jgi:hypothetical protein
MSTPNAPADGQHVGKVVQIIGPVLDVEFEGKYLPPIYQALRVVSDGFDVQNRSMSLPKYNNTLVKVGFALFQCCRLTAWSEA